MFRRSLPRFGEREARVCITAVGNNGWLTKSPSPSQRVGKKERKEERKEKPQKAAGKWDHRLSER